MYGRRQEAAGGKHDWRSVVLTDVIASLIALGAQQDVAEGFAKKYIVHNQMPTQVELDSYLEEMVNQYLDTSHSKVKQPSESKAPVVQIFDCGDEGTLRAVIKEVPSDGDCFLHCVIAFQHECLSKRKACPNFPLDAPVLRHQVVDFMRSNLDHPTMCSGISFQEYFNQNYHPSMPYSLRLKVCRSGKHSPESFYVNDVMSFLNVMSQPGTHVDEAFIAAFAELYQLRVQVITQARSEFRPLEFTDDPKLEAFVALGVSLKEARQLLIKYGDNVNRAMDEVLSRREPEPVVDSSKIRWQIQRYGDSTETTIGLVCSSGHYELMMPPPVSHQHEQQLCLPPRRQPQKLSAGGGAAEIPAQSAQPCRKASAGGSAARDLHQPPPSFSHSQLQAVATPQSWKVKLQKFFQSLNISVLAKNIVRPSGQYLTTNSDIQNRLCLLSSVEFDALRTFERISGAFLYNAPNITHLDFTTTHNIVTSFLIDKQMFRCTAVVFNDGHVIGFPELKNLQIDDPRRKPQRKAFYSDIDSHFQKNPRVVIDKMLFEHCV
jgi:hypothetical protein